MSLRNRRLSTVTAQVSHQGSILIPDSRLNTLTLLGTAEQIALVDGMMGQLDRRLHQLVLEVSLVELKQSAFKELGANMGVNGDGFGFGFNNTTANLPSTGRPYSGAAGLNTNLTNPLESLASWTNRSVVNSFRFTAQINALLRDNRAKLISHPTVVTLNDNESVISIVDEVIRNVTATITNTANTRLVATQANIGEVGIILHILPKVSWDNTISLRVRPVVSSIRDITQDIIGNVVTLVSTRELMAQNVLLRNGQSFVLGGLVQSNQNDIRGRIPLLGDVPIAGALARASSNTRDRSEVIVMVTPKLLQDDGGVAAAALEEVPPQNATTGVGNTARMPAKTKGEGLGNWHAGQTMSPQAVQVLHQPTLEPTSKKSKALFEDTPAPRIKKVIVDTP